MSVRRANRCQVDSCIREPILVTEILELGHKWNHALSDKRNKSILTAINSAQNICFYYDSSCIPYSIIYLPVLTTYIFRQAVLRGEVRFSRMFIKFAGGGTMEIGKRHTSHLIVNAKALCHGRRSRLHPNVTYRAAGATGGGVRIFGTFEYRFECSFIRLCKRIKSWMLKISWKQSSSFSSFWKLARSSNRALTIFLSMIASKTVPLQRRTGCSRDLAESRVPYGDAVRSCGVIHNAHTWPSRECDAAAVCLIS